MLMWRYTGKRGKEMWGKKRKKKGGERTTERTLQDVPRKNQHSDLRYVHISGQWNPGPQEKAVGWCLQRRRSLRRKEKPGMGDTRRRWQAEAVFLHLTPTHTHTKTDHVYPAAAAAWGGRSGPCSPPLHIAFTVCNEICNINHYYLSCDLDVDIEIEEQNLSSFNMSHYARSLAEHGKSVLNASPLLFMKYFT